ncbi:hypothetical protein OAN307_c26310 [Octadecabacter antarcticus 307]|uniref:Uncharacterized protein n=1 Tax=Octadecabacter antarcticus 307 TaxID=391626 RepID=M9REH8_9RHOB|nr:hypothetical protein [Octadecabacter antarcticus]AGI68220.1 hypothetical protein OAN307_c26310 [Octadecabacter antarcticus 307]
MTEEKKLEALLQEHSEDIARLRDSTANGYAFSIVSFIYSRLKEMGPWKPEDFTLEVLFEIDMHQSALVISYGRMFADGSRKISSKKIPAELQATHQEIMDLRNTRYAHNGDHETISVKTELEIDGKAVTVKDTLNSTMCLGAPQHWEPLIDWVGGYLVDQSRKERARLTEKTGLNWKGQDGPPPSWIGAE